MQQVLQAPCAGSKELIEVEPLAGLNGNRQEASLDRPGIHQSLRMIAETRSIGTGKMMVEFFSVAISVSV